MTPEERTRLVASLQRPDVSERYAEVNARLDAHYEMQRTLPPPTTPNGIEAAEAIGRRMELIERPGCPEAQGLPPNGREL